MPNPFSCFSPRSWRWLPRSWTKPPDLSVDVPPPVADAAVGWALGCSRQGARHCREGKLCQDAYSVRTGSLAGLPFVVLAVADGHGDQRHDLSHIGAAFAVSVAANELTTFTLEFGLTLDELTLSDRFRETIGGRIVSRWRGCVREHARTLSTENELEEVSPVDYGRYGTTLLCAITIGDQLLMAQLGDGDTVFVRPSGRLESPFPPMQEQVGGSTSSLASRDADTLMRTESIARSEGGLLMVATDGVSNSFRGVHEFHKFCRSLCDRIEEHGVQRISRELPKWLDSYSKRGSGDDMTVALALLQPVADHEVLHSREADENRPTAEDRGTKNGSKDSGDSASLT